MLTDRLAETLVVVPPMKYPLEPPASVPPHSAAGGNMPITSILRDVPAGISSSIGRPRCTGFASMPKPRPLKFVESLQPEKRELLEMPAPVTLTEKQLKSETTDGVVVVNAMTS